MLSWVHLCQYILPVLTYSTIKSIFGEKSLRCFVLEFGLFSRISRGIIDQMSIFSTKKILAYFCDKEAVYYALNTFSSSPEEIFHVDRNVQINNLLKEEVNGTCSFFSTGTQTELFFMRFLDI